jgi:hypothetical protein
MDGHPQGPNRFGEAASRKTNCWTITDFYYRCDKTGSQYIKKTFTICGFSVEGT